MEAAEGAFGSELEDARLGARAEAPAPVAGARRLRQRQAGRACRGLRVRPLDPGRRAAVRRRHLGRRPADAPAPRRSCATSCATSSTTSAAGASRSRRSGRRRRRSTAASATATAAPGIVAKSDPRRFSLKDAQAANVAVRLTDAEEAYRLFPAVYDAVRAGRAGMLSRSETWWKELRLADPKEWRRGASQKFYAVAEVDGERARGTRRTGSRTSGRTASRKSEVRVVELFATSTRGRARALALPALHRPDRQGRRLQPRPGVAALPQRPRSACARAAARRRALAAARRSRRGAEGALVQAGRVGRARGDRRALPLERRPLPRRRRRRPHRGHGRPRARRRRSRERLSRRLRLPPPRPRRPRLRAPRRRRRGGDAALPHRPAARTAPRCSSGPGTSARPPTWTSSSAPSARSATTSAAGPRTRRRRSGSRATCRSSGCTPRSTATGSSAAPARSRSS